MKNYFSPKGKFTGTIMPRFILKRKDLCGDAKILYAELANLAGNNEFCFPSQAYLADLLDLSIRTIQRLLDQLVSVNLIEKKLGRFGSTIKYFFVESEKVELYQKHIEIENNPKKEVQTVSTYANQTTSTYDKLSGGYDKLSHLNNLNNKYKNTPPNPPKNNENKIHEVEENSYFEEFWNLYPKKINKFKTFKAWKELNPNLEQIKTIFNALKQQKIENSSWNLNNGQWIPTPSNWLADQRWNDSAVKTQVEKICNYSRSYLLQWKESLEAVANGTWDKLKPMPMPMPKEYLEILNT